MNYNDLELSVGERIRFYRETKKMSQMELAKKTDISNTSISNFEKGHTKPGVVTLARLSQALGVSIDDLFFGDINERFITSVEDEASVVVNCICKLWETGVLNIYDGDDFFSVIEDYIPGKSTVFLGKYQYEIVRLLKALRDFDAHRESYPDAQSFLKALKDSATNEIRKRKISCLTQRI